MSDDDKNNVLDEPETSAERQEEQEDLGPANEANEAEIDLRKQMGRMTRRNFLALGIGAIGAVAGWEWIQAGSDAGGIPYPLRKAHEFNETLSQSIYSPQRLAPTYPIDQARMPRVNGNEGVDEDFDPAKWKLQVIGVLDGQRYDQFVSDVSYDYSPDEAETDESDEIENTEDNESVENGEEDTSESGSDEVSEPEISGLLLTLDIIKALPRYEMVTELKCIEGWSEKVHWAGARLSDFIAKFPPPTRDGSAPDVINKPQSLVRYVGLQTPDEGYYVGLDMASALHPQTLLCYEMDGVPLALEHGAPLRLVTPLKYGIKHIKRIGRITFTDDRPNDFWAERGYDWYSGH